MLANGISFAVVVLLTPIIGGQTMKDGKIVMFVIVFMQAVAFVLILVVKKVNHQVTDVNIDK